MSQKQKQKKSQDLLKSVSTIEKLMEKANAGAAASQDFDEESRYSDNEISFDTTTPAAAKKKSTKAGESAVPTPSAAESGAAAAPAPAAKSTSAAKRRTRPVKKQIETTAEATQDDREEARRMESEEEEESAAAAPVKQGKKAAKKKAIPKKKVEVPDSDEEMEEAEQESDEEMPARKEEEDIIEVYEADEAHQKTGATYRARLPLKRIADARIAEEQVEQIEELYASEEGSLAFINGESNNAKLIRKRVKQLDEKHKLSKAEREACREMIEEGNALNKAPFLRLLREIIEEIAPGKGLRLSKTGFTMLQAAAERELIDYFFTANVLATTIGKRQSVNTGDVKLASVIRGLQGDGSGLHSQADFPLDEIIEAYGMTPRQLTATYHNMQAVNIRAAKSAYNVLHIPSVIDDVGEVEQVKKEKHDLYKKNKAKKEKAAAAAATEEQEKQEEKKKPKEKKQKKEEEEKEKKEKKSDKDKKSKKEDKTSKKRKRSDESDAEKSDDEEEAPARSESAAEKSKESSSKKKQKTSKK